MRKVLDWKFFLRVAVAVAALTLFLSAALAVDGAEAVRSYDATRSADVRLREAQLAFLKSYIREHSADLERYIKGEKKIETTINIGSTEYKFSGSLQDLIHVGEGTSLENFMKLIDKEIDTLRSENKDHLTAQESKVVVPEPKAVGSDAGSSDSSTDSTELIKSLVRCIKDMQDEFNKSIQTSAVAMALIKAELDKTKKDQADQVAQLMQVLGFKEQMRDVSELTSDFSKFASKYGEFKRAQEMGDTQRAGELNSEVQLLIADIYPKVDQQKRNLSYQLQMGQVQLAQLEQEFNKKETGDERKEAIKKEAQVLKGQIGIALNSLQQVMPIENKLREILQETQVTQSVRQQNLMRVSPEQADALRAIVGGVQFQGQGVAVARRDQPQQARNQTFAGFLRTRENPHTGSGSIQSPQPVRTPTVNDDFVQTFDPRRGTFEGDMAAPTPWRNPFVDQEQQMMQSIMQQQARQAQSVQQDIFSGRLNFI